VIRVRSLVALVLAAVATTALAGCGDETNESPGAELAGFVPPDAVAYAEAVVRPEGDLRDNLDSALGTLLATEDPGGMIVDALNEQLANDGLTYEDAIEPWLGERAAIFATRFGSQPEYAFVVETTDPEAAMDTIRADLEDEATVEDRSYEGTDYLLAQDEDFAATGIVDDHLITGSVSGFERVVDAAAGESVADSGGLGPEFDAVSGGLLAFYADPKAVIDALAEGGDIPAAQLEAIQAQIGAAGEAPVVGGLDVTENSFTLEFSSATGDTAVTAASDLFESLPAGSWLAFATGGLGAAAEHAISAFDAQVNASPVVPPELRGGLEATLQRELGIDIREVLGWMGDAAGYVSGTSIFGLSAALIIETDDEAATLRTLDQVRSALERSSDFEITPLSAGGQGFQIVVPETPVQMPIVVQDGRLVAGLGEASVEQALSPDEPLTDSEAFDSVAGALGDDFRPLILIDAEPIVQLVESTGVSTSDSDYAEAKPYLDAIDFFAAGVREDGDRSTVRFVLGVDG